MADETGLRVRVVPQPPATAEIDVVVLHGLGGHALRTFQAPNKKNWTIDPEFLPSILPRARVLTFGYNANLFDDVVTSRVVDHAMKLCSELLVERIDCEDRPILFIGHSMGGIIIKRALIFANARTDFKPILEATCAIAFLGTPHHGSEIAGSGWLSIAQRMVAAAHLSNSRERVSQELKPFSDTLRDISQSFIDIAMKFRMRSFTEQKETHFLPLKPNQLVVPQGSATMSHPKELVVPLAETHESIVKYSDPQNESYQTIVRQLDYLVKLSIKELNAAKAEAAQLQTRLNQLAEPSGKVSNKHWLVPQVLSKHFRGRNHILYQIQGELSVSSSDQCRVILTGLGGVGKNDPKIFGQPSRRIPSNSTGHVIITTRRKLPLLHKLGTSIQVGILNEDESVQMLLSVSVDRTRQQNDPETASKLVNLLGHLPLAIQQCGAYVSCNNEELGSYLSSLRDTLTKIEPRTGNEDEEEGLEESWSAPAEDELPQTVLTTWEISYSRIRQQNALAASFISLCAFLDGQNVSKELLVAGLSPCRAWVDNGNIVYQSTSVRCLPSLDTTGNEARIDKAIALVVSYSLLFPARDQQYFFHPVTHYWMLHRLSKDNEEIAQLFSDAVNLIFQGYPRKEFELSYGDHIKRRRVDQWDSHVARLTSVFEDEGLETKCSLDIKILREFVQLIELSGERRHISDTLQLLLNDAELWFWTIYYRFSDFWYDTIPGKDFYGNILQLRYVGRNWSDNIRMVKDKFIGNMPTARSRLIQHEERLRELQMTPGLVEPFLPLKRIETTAENARLISGIVGQILIKIIGEWHSRIREQKTVLYTDDYGMEHRILEARTGKLIMTKWVSQTLSTGVSTIELLCIARMANMYAGINAPIDSIQNLRLREVALRIMIPILGFENHEVAMTCQQYLSTMIRGGLNHLHRVETFMRDHLPCLNSTNFTAINKAIEYWCCYLQRRGNLIRAQELLLNAFLVFWNAPANLRIHWMFTNDPVLDVCEHLMVFYHDIHKRRYLFAFIKGAYIFHFEQRYGSPFQRLCLGCGVGVLGMPFSRTRVHLKREGDRLRFEIVLDDTDIMLLKPVSTIPVPQNTISQEERNALFAQAMAEEGKRIPSFK